MRLMTGVAEHPARVFGSDNLREALRFSRVLFVTATAEIGNIRQLRFVRNRVVGMLRLRPVTSLTGHVGVLTKSAGFGLVFMAGHAGPLAGKRYGLLADGAKCARPVVTVLAE